MRSHTEERFCICSRGKTTKTIGTSRAAASWVCRTKISKVKPAQAHEVSPSCDPRGPQHHADVLCPEVGEKPENLPLRCKVSNPQPHYPLLILCGFLIDTNRRLQPEGRLTSKHKLARMPVTWVHTSPSCLVDVSRKTQLKALLCSLPRPPVELTDCPLSPLGLSPLFYVQLH